MNAFAEEKEQTLNDIVTDLKHTENVHAVALAALMLARGVKYIANALFAINEIYPLGDKRAMTSPEECQTCAVEPGTKSRRYSVC